MSGFTKQQYMGAFTQYLLMNHRDEIESILLELDDTQHFGVEIDCMRLQEGNALLVQQLLAHSQTVLPYFDESILAAQKEILSSGGDEYMMNLKHNCHARLCSLPTNPETTKPNVSSLRASDCGKFVALQGTVIRAGMVKMLEAEREYICKKCKHVFVVSGDVELGNVMQPPTTCPNEQCNGSTFVPTDSPPVCRDYQEMKIQEQVQKLTMGFIPRSILVVLTDEIVDGCKAGDDVTVTGTVLRKWSNLKNDGVRCDLEMFVYASHLSVSMEDKGGKKVTDEMQREFEEFWEHHAANPLQGRNQIVRSVCPRLYGMFHVKLSLLLSLIGGVPRTDEVSGMRIRGESHLLLVGDAGTGKSECLRFGASIASRAVLTNGIGTTSAGLTVTAVRDSSGEWMLEAGALVLADGGVCCVDEFEAMREHDRTTIHEAMEQQTVSVAKAGLVCKLHTRTTVVAAINPKGKYDTEMDLSVNVALASPLLSRFDIVLVLLDNQDQDWDRTVSSYLLKQAGKGAGGAAAAASSVAPWSMDKLRAYLTCVRTTIKPELTREAEAVLSRYYQAQRGTDNRNAARTTIRLLESLVRVAQAHARLMFRDKVRLEDAVTAVLCIECSKHTTALAGYQSALRSEFPEDADEEYFQLEEAVLHRLGLSNLLSQSYRNRRGKPSQKHQAHPHDRPPPLVAHEDGDGEGEGEGEGEGLEDDQNGDGGPGVVVVVAAPQAGRQDGPRKKVAKAFDEAQLRAQEQAGVSCSRYSQPPEPMQAAAPKPPTPSPQPAEPVLLSFSSENAPSHQPAQQSQGSERSARSRVAASSSPLSPLPAQGSAPGVGRSTPPSNASSSLSSSSRADLIPQPPPVRAWGLLSGEGRVGQAGNGGAQQGDADGDGDGDGDESDDEDVLV